MQAVYGIVVFIYSFSSLWRNPKMAKKKKEKTEARARALIEYAT